MEFQTLLIREPILLSLPRLGQPNTGYLSVISNDTEELPFKINRVFWAYDTPENTGRGGHAHHHTSLFLVALHGEIEIRVNSSFKPEEQTFFLRNASEGLYLPPLVWHTILFSPGAVLLVVASTFYTEEDYIRSKEDLMAAWEAAKVN